MPVAMQVESNMKTSSQAAAQDLADLLRAARADVPQYLNVWAFLRPARGSEQPHAEPIQVRLKISGSPTTWQPINGRTLDGSPIELDVLNSSRVWWGGWPRRFAAARDQVE